MTSFPPTGAVLLLQPRDYTAWDANRDRIYEYYLVENKELHETKRLMEARYRFPVFDENMWEHVLRRHFGFRKNLSKSDWVPIGQIIGKRRREWKDTAIDLCGAQIPKRRIKKNIPREIEIEGEPLPELPRDIRIRTPPPLEPFASRELQRRVNMSDLPHTSSAAIAFITDLLPERIMEVRSDSPFIQTMLRLSVLLESYMVTDNDLRDSFASLAQMYQQCPSPTMFGACNSLEILSFACFSTSSGRHIPEPRPLLDWIGKVVDLRFLQGIFSANTPTLIEFWSNLLRTALFLHRFEALKWLTEVGLRVATGQWARFCLLICNQTYEEGRMRDHRSLEYVRSIIETKILAKGVTIIPISPNLLWGSALKQGDIAMMKILVQAGYKFTDLDVIEQQDCFRRALFSTEQLNATCLSYLLEIGMTSAPVLDNGVYWRGPRRPILARDALWFHDGESTMLFDELCKSSSRGDETITVSGICGAASGGLDSLEHYMGTTPCATVEIKTVLLEIALSEAAHKGCCDVLDCLLDYGIDPNVSSLGGNKYSGLKSSPKSWNPTVRAIEKCNLEAVRKLLFRHPVLHCHACFIGVMSQPVDDCWAATIELLETSGLNPQRFGDDEIIKATLPYRGIRSQRQIRRLWKIFELYNIPFDKKVHGVTLLQMAIREGCSLGIVEVLLRHGVDGGSELLYDALNSLSDDRERIVELLLDRGIDPSTGDANLLLEAALCPRSSYRRSGTSYKGESLRLYSSMLERGVRWTVKAPSCGTNLITLLLRAGAEDCLIADALDAGYDLDLQGQQDRRTPLMEAIKQGRLELALDFIRRGANVNAMTNLEASNWDYGYKLTALHSACSRGAPLAFLKTLFDFGAQVNAGAEIEALTSLHCAVSAGHLNIASLLIARGAEINTGFKVDGMNFAATPLDFAAATGNLEVCQLLYDLGGRSGCSCITDVDGAVQLARDQNNLGVLRFFEERVEGLDRIPDLEDED
ncbi:ankyrin repeat-containing domain protein [Apiospora saccharicola]